MNVILILCICACDSNSPSQSSPKPLEISQFPHGVGSSWIYLITDSASGTIDTMTVLIADTATPPSGFTAAELWTYSAPGTPTDSVPMIYNDSTAVLSSPVGSVDISFPVRSPAEVITVPAGTFAESYQISAGYRFPDSLYFFVHYWLVKDKGIVKFTYESNTTTPALNYQAELVRYIPAP